MRTIRSPNKLKNEQSIQFFHGTLDVSNKFNIRMSHTKNIPHLFF